MKTLIKHSKSETGMYQYRLPINGNDVNANCRISRPTDNKAFLEHALVMVFANPDLTKEEMLKCLKHFKPTE